MSRVDIRYVTVRNVVYLREDDVIRLLDGEGIGESREVIERVLEGIRAAAAFRGSAQECYEIASSDVGKALIEAFGRQWAVCEFVGSIMSFDVGKRVYQRGGVLQVESNEQFKQRLRFKMSDEICGKAP